MLWLNQIQYSTLLGRTGRTASAMVGCTSICWPCCSETTVMTMVNHDRLTRLQLAALVILSSTSSRCRQWPRTGVPGLDSF